MFGVPYVSNSKTPVNAMWDVEPYVLDLSEVIRLSEDDLLKISAANPDLRIEQNAAGQLEIMSPSGSRSTNYEARIVRVLGNWNEDSGKGEVFTGTGGFRLPNGAIRAADVAWVRRDAWEALTRSQQEKFAPVVPEFVVEIRSPSDRLPALEAKVREWIENGCKLAWLIDPIDSKATIYRADGSTETQPMDAVLSGEDVLPGFSFDLKTLPID